MGMIYVVASIVAGILWTLNPNYAFSFAALVSMIALVYFIVEK
jgi:hypothetical protein